MTSPETRSAVLAHLETAGQARARYRTASDTQARQSAVLDEQTAGLQAAALLSSHVGTRHALLRVVYDLPDASPEEKLAAMLDQLTR